MTKKLVMQAVVSTNAVKDSVCRIDVEAVTFAQLWNACVTGNPFRDAKTGEVPPGYGNQCAIRMSATLHKVGVEMKSYTPAHVTVKPGNVFGRILLNGKYTATRADQMGSWLSKQPVCGLPPKPEDVTGKDWENKVRGRTGIIMFDGYWSRAGESASNASGGHRPLEWLSDDSTPASIGRWLGMSRFVPELPIGWSDLAESKAILFWEVK